MAIALPICPVPNEVQPLFVDAGGDLVPFLPGGVVQRINRIGSRMGMRFTYPPLDNAEARQFTTRLLRGKQDSVLVPWPLFDFDPGNPPAPVVATTITGMALPLSGLGAGYEVREGQPLSVIHDGHRYLHISTGDVIADGSGAATIGIFPPSRVTFTAGDVVELVMPMIEGRVSPGDELSWSVALTNETEIPFTVVERR
jgi:hypothetical protein